jgi:hypothetical protein
VPRDPVRLLDTRTGTGLSGAFQTGVVRTFQITGVSGIPANAVAVTGNLTVTRQTSKGYVSLGPTMSSVPTTSTLNVPKGDTRANGVTVSLSSAGRLAAVWNGGAASSAHLVLDVTGYFVNTTTGATYIPRDPVRLLDTRTSNGLSGPFRSSTVRTFQVAGRGGVPSSAIAVTGNLTVTGQTSRGYVSLGSTMSSMPVTSTLNLPKGDTRANGVTASLSSTGRLAAVWKGEKNSTANLIFDVTGYFVPGSSGARYVAVAPTRLLDSRTGNGLVGTFRPGIVRTFGVAGRGGVSTAAVAVTGNLTITGQTSRGYVSAGPMLASAPPTSTLNAPKGETRANGVTIPLSSAGRLAAVWMGSTGSTAHLVFDVTGYFVAER